MASLPRCLQEHLTFDGNLVKILNPVSTVMCNISRIVQTKMYLIAVYKQHSTNSYV